jgi:multidrug efflux pump subunit AcrA (membrane-fusion protein)
MEWAMKRKAFATGIVLLVLALASCQVGKQPTPTPGVSADYVPVVSVTGELVPQKWVSLSHKTGGKVAEVSVEPGDPVAAGAVLARVDTVELESALEIARQDLAAQQAALDRLIEGASEQTIARADRDHAQQVGQAEIALEVSQAQLAQAQAHDPARDVEAVQARIRQLEATQAQARAQDLSPEVMAAQVEVERAKIALDDTQNEYNKALDRPWEDQEIRDGWAKQLEQAQLNYRAAQARLDSATNAQRAHALSLDALDAQLQESRVALAQAVDAQKAYSVTLSILSDEVEASRLQLSYLQAWENPLRDKASAPETAQAQAMVRRAEWAVRQIEQQIADAEVRAPFAGTVGSVDVRVGEVVSPGQPLIALGDLGTLRVETTDLDEIDVVQISLDQDVVVTFDALPDHVFPGRVTRISPMAEPGSGGVHYTVVIELAEMDPALRWGMTAFVDIETGN